MNNVSFRFVRLICLLCVVATGGVGVCQSGAVLDAKVTSVETEYCAHASDITIAKMQMNVLFQNKGRENLILFRNLDALPVSARDMSGKVVLRRNSMGGMYSLDELLVAGENPDSRLFEILKPGESTARTIKVTLLVARDPAHPNWADLVPGTYLLRVVLETLPPFKGEEAHVRKMISGWKRFGVLVTSQVAIESRIQVLPPDEPRSCYSEKSIEN